MKKTPLLLVLVVFAFFLFYLHQKIQIYTVAFQLSKNYNDYQEAAAQKDYLRYSFSKKASLAYVSDWSSEQNFSAPGQERLFAFKPASEVEIQIAQERSFFERLQIPASISDVFARDP